MFRRLFLLASCAALTASVGARAQLGLPRVTGAVGGLLDGVTDALPLDRLERLSPARAAQSLLQARTDRLAAFVRANGRHVAWDDRGQPAVRGHLLLVSPGGEALATLRQHGYAVEANRLEGLDIGFAQLTVPEGETLARTLRRVRRLVPGVEVSGDTLYFASGAAPVATGLALAASTSVESGAIGLIDGGVAPHATLTGPIEQRGFAKGAPAPSGHGTAVASLLTGTGLIKGAAPGAPLLVADIYGRDPAGGGALAIARALGWMTARGARVVTISLVGPENPLLAGAIRLARERGVTIVAAVGNDGPAAPPAYPASYPGVLAVTGVDARDRALIEAGRALHLDFAAPGADMVAANIAGGAARVRGTSFAAPFVAGRLYAHRRRAEAAAALSALSAEAKDLGRRGPDNIYGQGLVCGSCRTPR